MKFLILEKGEKDVDVSKFCGNYCFFFHIKRVQDYPDVCTVLQRKLKAISCQDGMNYIVYM